MKKPAAGRPQRVFGTSGPRTRNSRNLTLGIQISRPRILIVCEGEKTEPNYFRAFRVTNNVHGIGKETIRVVEEAERINTDEGPFDQIWCVFDRDSFPPHDFDNAIHKVQSREQEGFRVAFSNEAFELWYLLHFEYLTAALSRSRYCEKLHTHLKRRYRKGDADIYSLLQTEGDEAQAMRNAEKLLAACDAGTPYSRCCPSTTVHNLVAALREVQQHRGY